MTERNFTESYAEKGTCALRKQRDRKIFQGITLIALLFFWVGYGYALYSGNSGNASTYSLQIVAFSILNSDVLFTKEKVENGVLNIIAKVCGVLFFVWVIITIVSLLI